jgi:hypothetical protein
MARPPSLVWPVVVGRDAGAVHGAVSRFCPSRSVKARSGYGRDAATWRSRELVRRECWAPDNRRMLVCCVQAACLNLSLLS